MQFIELAPEDIYAVEIVGGSTRVPAIKQLVLSIFGKEPSTTRPAGIVTCYTCTYYMLQTGAYTSWLSRLSSCLCFYSCVAVGNSVYFDSQANVFSLCHD